MSTAQKIPTFDTPFYDEVVNLEGVNYRLYFQYNQRENCWYLSIADELGNDLTNGHKLVLGVAMLYRKRYVPGLPPGDFFVFSNSTDDSPPGLEDLADGARCQLIYMTSV